MNKRSFLKALSVLTLALPVALLPKESETEDDELFDDEWEGDEIEAGKYINCGFQPRTAIFWFSSPLEGQLDLVSMGEHGFTVTRPSGENERILYATGQLSG